MTAWPFWQIAAEHHGRRKTAATVKRSVQTGQLQLTDALVPLSSPKNTKILTFVRNQIRQK
jgi:hypothetical protein